MLGPKAVFAAESLHGQEIGMSALEKKNTPEVNERKEKMKRL